MIDKVNQHLVLTLVWFIHNNNMANHIPNFPRIPKSLNRDENLT